MDQLVYPDLKDLLDLKERQVVQVLREIVVFKGLLDHQDLPVSFLFYLPISSSRETHRPGTRERFEATTQRPNLDLRRTRTSTSSQCTPTSTTSGSSWRRSKSPLVPGTVRLEPVRTCIMDILK